MELTPLQRFYTSNTNPKTRKSYEIQFNGFLKWSELKDNEFVNLTKQERTDIVLQYIQYLIVKTNKFGTPAPSSYTPITSSIFSFCEANTIEINQKLIKKSCPKIEELSNQFPYVKEDIEKMISVSDNLRDIAFIHLMASTAPRIGEVNKIKIGDITQIEDGAILTMYARQPMHEYRVPMTPECYKHIKNYLDKRKNVSPDVSLFTTSGISERPLSYHTVIEFMKRLRYKIENVEKNGKRKSKAPNNGFRKRLQICYSNARMDFRYADYFLNHNLGKQDKYYFRKMTNEDIWEAFKRAIPFITLDESEKMKVEYEKKELKLRESYEGEFKEKLESLEAKMVQMEFESAMKTYSYLDGIFKMELEELTPEKLKSTFPLGMIDDWNKACNIVGKEYPQVLERKIPISQSERYKSQIESLKNIKKSVKKLKKENEFHPEIITEIEQNGKGGAKEQKLDYDRY